jgi:hypothetical protein
MAAAEHMLEVAAVTPPLHGICCMLQEMMFSHQSI